MRSAADVLAIDRKHAFVRLYKIWILRKLRLGGVWIRVVIDRGAE